MKCSKQALSVILAVIFGFEKFKERLSRTSVYYMSSRYEYKIHKKYSSMWMTECLYFV